MALVPVCSVVVVTVAMAGAVASITPAVRGSIGQLSRREGVVGEQWRLCDESFEARYEHFECRYLGEHIRVCFVGLVGGFGDRRFHVCRSRAALCPTGALGADCGLQVV